MRNRDYSASLGRFVQRDPIGFAAGDNNLYRFVGNGPTTKVDPLGLEANIINPFTWDHGSPDGSWWNFLNPFSKINGDTAWGTGAGIAQGACNAANSGTDLAVGIANVPSRGINSLVAIAEYFGLVDRHRNFRFPRIEAWDWSRNLITHEPGTGWKDTHRWSKFGAISAMTAGLALWRLWGAAAAGAGTDVPDVDNPVLDPIPDECPVPNGGILNVNPFPFPQPWLRDQPPHLHPPNPFGFPELPLPRPGDWPPIMPRDGADLMPPGTPVPWPVPPASDN
jgi:hypothetical protein